MRGVFIMGERFRIENVAGKNFIVDNSTRRKKNDKITTFKSYATDDLSINDLVELMNSQQETINCLKAYLVRYKQIDYDELEDIINDERLSEWWSDIE